MNGSPDADEMVVSPVHVIEVLSPSTARYDRLAKRRLDQRMRVERWIVDLDSELIERWLPESKRPEIGAERLVGQPEGALEAIELDVAGFMRKALGARS